MMRFRTGILVLACVKLGCFAASDIRTIQPFSELDLCLPFNVRLEHPTDMKSYRVLINGDASVVKAIKTLWQASSVYFINVPYDIPGVLYLTAANASFQSAMPVNITVQVPPKALQVIDVTMGTQVSLASGFQWSQSPGVWNVPSGALLLAPNVSIHGPLAMSAVGSALDPPFRRGGRIVWTNAQAKMEALQAISLEGPATVVVNSTTALPDMQSFSLQPSMDAPDSLTTSYANITLAVEPGNVGYMSQAALRTTYYPNRTCYNSEQCYIRVITGVYPVQERVPPENVAFSETDYIPLDLVDAPVSWAACAQGITNFKCESDATNSTCAAPAGA